jgi:hypothetical protein
MGNDEVRSSLKRLWSPPNQWLCLSCASSIHVWSELCIKAQIGHSCNIIWFVLGTLHVTQSVYLDGVCCDPIFWIRLVNQPTGKISLVRMITNPPTIQTTLDSSSPTSSSIQPWPTFPKQPSELTWVSSDWVACNRFSTNQSIICPPWIAWL